MFANAYLDIDWTGLVKVIVLRFVHPQKAFASIVVTPLNVTDVRFSQLNRHAYEALFIIITVLSELQKEKEFLSQVIGSLTTRDLHSLKAYAPIEYGRVHLDKSIDSREKQQRNEESQTSVTDNETSFNDVQNKNALACTLTLSLVPVTDFRL